MIYACDSCGTDFDANENGSICSVCGGAFCPECEGKFFFNSLECSYCKYEMMDSEYNKIPKASERIW